FCDGDFWCLRDRGSIGGTFIDENRLFVSAIRLEAGQRIRLGTGSAAVQLVVVDGAADERDELFVDEQVDAFVKTQKRSRRALPQRWKIAIPSVGVL
ncbi:hypothetical protein P5E74_14295, partial [Clostridium perfringens]|nr:hypothetical protein [Clostridium perfringens]